MPVGWHQDGSYWPLEPMKVVSVWLAGTHSKKNNGCIIFTKNVDNPSEFGVAEVDNKGNVLLIEEKPKTPKSNLAVVGIYIFDHLAMDNIKQLEPSDRGEYEITDLINIYINQSSCLNVELSDWWIDAGTPDRIIELESKLF